MEVTDCKGAGSGEDHDEEFGGLPGKSRLAAAADGDGESCGRGEDEEPNDEATPEVGGVEDVIGDEEDVEEEDSGDSHLGKRLNLSGGGFLVEASFEGRRK